MGRVVDRRCVDARILYYIKSRFLLTERSPAPGAHRPPARGTRFTVVRSLRCRASPSALWGPADDVR